MCSHRPPTTSSRVAFLFLVLFPTDRRRTRGILVLSVDFRAATTWFLVRKDIGYA